MLTICCYWKFLFGVNNNCRFPHQVSGFVQAYTIAVRPEARGYDSGSICLPVLDMKLAYFRYKFLLRVIIFRFHGFMLIISAPAYIQNSTHDCYWIGLLMLPDKVISYSDSFALFS